MSIRLWPIVLMVAAACGDRPSGGANPICGVAMVAGATKLLDEFRIPNQTLSAPPRTLPERLVARFVAGPAVPAIVGRTDSAVVVGVDSAPPSNMKPGFGVLAVDAQDRARGVMIYERDPVEGAPRIGEVSVGSTRLPLVGIQVDPARIEDPNCQFFPDSVLR
jgi:hypothetical protein